MKDRGKDRGIGRVEIDMGSDSIRVFSATSASAPITLVETRQKPPSRSATSPEFLPEDLVDSLATRVLTDLRKFYPNQVFREEGFVGGDPDLAAQELRARGITPGQITREIISRFGEEGLAFPKKANQQVWKAIGDRVRNIMEPSG